VTKGSPTGKGGATASLARVAGNSGWSVVAFLVGIAANLITLPFVIRQLGIYAFGVCGLIVAISTPFTLVGTTIGQATAQGIARYRARGDETAVHDFCATIALVACAGITVTGVLLALLIPALVNVLYAQYKSTFVSAWMVGSLLAIGWMAQQFALVMQGVHIACQDYRRIAAVNGAAAILTPLTIITIVSVVGTAEAYIGALAVGYLLTSLVWVASLRAKFRWSLVAPRVHARVAHSIFSFTGWQMLAQLISSVAAQVDRYLLGSWVGGTAVGYYNVSQRLEEVAYIGVLKVGDALFPQFSANADEQLSRQADVFFRSAWMLNLVAAMVLGPLIPLAASILQVWVGPDMSTHAGNCAAYPDYRRATWLRWQCFRPLFFGDCKDPIHCDAERPYGSCLSRDGYRAA
jgi:O-antigen/teichoic acid export membrane protein